MSPEPLPGKRPPAMTDVAAAAGVSHQTVSRVINNKGKVKPETRERVLKVIAELGYRPNEAARALVTRQSKLVGIITTTSAHFGPISTLLSVQLAAKEKGYYVTVASLSEFSPENLREVLDLFLGQGVVGIVVIAPVEEVARELDGFSIPVPTVAVSSSWTPKPSDIIRVGVDQRSGARDAVEFLRGKGCRSITHFAGPENWFDAKEREAGWRMVMADQPADNAILLRGDWSAESGYRMAKELLAGDLPDAVFVANDQMALGALRAFSEADVKLPEDIRLVGFDDEVGSAYFYPSLTTVRQDFHSLGYHAIDALMSGLTERGVDSLLIPATLIARDSA